MPELFDYDAYLTFADKEEDTLWELTDLFSRAGIEASVDASYLEFSYSGRDTGRMVVEILKEAAVLLENCEGEVICQPNIEGDDPVFEFYQIRGGELWRQFGRVVRGEKKVVASAEA